MCPLKVNCGYILKQLCDNQCGRVIALEDLLFEKCHMSMLALPGAIRQALKEPLNGHPDNAAISALISQKSDMDS